MSDSVRPHRRKPTRLRHPWDSPGKNTGMGCHFLLQCVKVKTQGSNPGLLHCGWIVYQLSHQMVKTWIPDFTPNPLQCSCLENPRDGGAWWASVYGVAQSRTRLKRLSSTVRDGRLQSRGPSNFHLAAETQHSKKTNSMLQKISKQIKDRSSLHT